MRFAQIITTTLLTVCFIAAKCIDPTDENYVFTIDYLQHYGYLTSDVEAFPAHRRHDVLRNAIEDFQKYYGLSVDGTLNNETLQLMRKPRCGLRDILYHEDANMKPLTWPRTNLTWDFVVAVEDELKTAQRAFDLWSQQSALTFERSVIRPDIIISWRTLHHRNTNTRINGQNCSSTFDGVGGVLAHAFLPDGRHDFVSEVHVDAEEPWYIYLDENPSDTYALLLTLAHEIGHSLGLSHVARETSIMFAFMPRKQFPVQLDQQDIVNIQKLYGKKRAAEPTPIPPPSPSPAPPSPSPPPPPPPSPDLCSLRRVHAILILEKRMFVSYKRHIWSIDLNDGTYAEPVALSDHMKFLPHNYKRAIVAYQSPYGDLMLFVDNLVYMVKYPEFTLHHGWPKTLQDIGFPPRTKINGAVNTHRGRSFVLYNDHSIAEIDECAKRIVRYTPLETTFPGIPAGVRSIFRHIDGNLYFVTETQFYRFNEFTQTVTAAGKFDLRILNIVCPRTELLKQLRDLMSRILRHDDDAQSPPRDDSNDTDGNGGFQISD